MPVYPPNDLTEVCEDVRDIYRISMANRLDSTYCLYLAATTAMAHPNVCRAYEVTDRKTHRPLRMCLETLNQTTVQIPLPPTQEKTLQRLMILAEMPGPLARKRPAMDAIAARCPATLHAYLELELYDIDNTLDFGLNQWRFVWHLQNTTSYAFDLAPYGEESR